MDRPPRLHPIPLGVTSRGGRTLAELRRRELEAATYEPDQPLTGAQLLVKLGIRKAAA